MAYIVMAYIVMAYIVAAYIAMAYISYGLHSCGLHSYGLHSCGLHSYGLHSYGLYSYGMCSYREGHRAAPQARAQQRHVHQRPERAFNTSVHGRRRPRGLCRSDGTREKFSMATPSGSVGPSAVPPSACSERTMPRSDRDLCAHGGTAPDLQMFVDICRYL